MENQKWKRSVDNEEVGDRKVDGERLCERGQEEMKKKQKIKRNMNSGKQENDIL